MFVCFFDHKEIDHYEFIGQSQMVNQGCYLKVLTRLHKSAPRKRSELWRNNWIFHHDNDPVHDAVRDEILAKKFIIKVTIHLIPDFPLRFLALSKIKKRPEGTKIC
jgi:hypothetical protein